MTGEQTAERDMKDLVSIESERAVSTLLARRRLSRSYHWIYRRSEDYTKAHLPSVIDGLCDQNVIAANGDGTWSLLNDAADEKPAGKANDADAKPPVSVAWEEALFEALRQKGAHVALHRNECGYVLALALTAFAAKLDVEIDGRQHQELSSQKAKDIIRDQRLKASGWTVLRLTVGEVVGDLNGSRDKVLAFWNKLKDGGIVE